MARRPSSNPSTDSDEDEDDLRLGPLALPTDIRKLEEYLREYILGTPIERAFLRRIWALRDAGLVGERGFLFGDQVEEDLAYEIRPDKLDEASCRRILAAAREEYKRAKDREYEEKRRERERKRKRRVGKEAMMHSRAMQAASNLSLDDEMERLEQVRQRRIEAARMRQATEKARAEREARLAEKRQREGEAEAAAAAEKKQKQEAIERQRAAERAAEEEELRRRAEERAKRLEAERQWRQRREMERQEMQNAVAQQTAAAQHMESFIRDATDQLEMLTAQIAGLDVEMASNSSVREGLERLERQSRSGETFAEIERLRARFLFFRGEWERATRERNLLRNTIEEARRTLEEIRAQPPQQRYDLRRFSLGGPSRQF